jgi:hypothetical protein
VDLAAFKQSLSSNDPPELSIPLRGLWYAAKGNWDTAHETVQDDESKDSAWVHAYLHRVEGDASNAAYWYRRAGRPVANEPLEKEWQSLVETLLQQS